MSKEILNFKALNGQVGVDEALGVVECFVAVIGNKDSVGDVIIPGAFNKSLKRRKPRVVWGHDWNQPIGKVLDIFEVPPSDPRLPMKVKELGLGAVYARVQFNLKSERGREAFASVTFFGEEQEWSIGYKTLDAVFDPKMQANILKELELYEVSPVLHGANQLTSTLSIKSAVASLMAEEKTADDNGFAVDPFKKAIALSLATQSAVSVRVKGYDAESVVYEVLDVDGTKAYASSYSFDGEEFSFGEAVSVDDENCTKGADGPCWPGYVQIGMKKGKDGKMVPNCVPADEKSSEDVTEEVKVGNSPGNSQIENLVSLVPGGDRAQSEVEGRIPGGKRGGNLATLLRYWRKIMVQEGGFRRCRVILADHPELYPLNNICAWLHHETTGLWPNEGCHHPGMKNCRRKLKKAGKKPSGPSLWTNAEFANRIERNIPGKSLEMMGAEEGSPWDENVESAYEMAKMWSNDAAEDEGDDFDETDYKTFAEMLKGYFAENPDVAQEVMDDANWMHEGEDMNGDWSEHAWLVHGVRDPHDDCGCGGMKSDGGVATKNLEVEDEVDENPLATALKTVLSDAFAMYLKAHGYHWNVQGQDFSQYHLLFAEIYVDVLGSIDPIAENIRKLRSFAPYKLSEFAAMTGVEETMVTSDPQSLARDLKETNDRVISSLYNAFKVAESMNEQGIMNFIGERIDEHEKWRWQLEASIEKPLMKSAEQGLLVKVGRVLSGKNMAKLQMAYEALGEVINGGSPQQNVQVKDDEIEIEVDDPESFVAHVSPLAEYHGIEIGVKSIDGVRTVTVKSLNKDSAEAFGNAMSSYSTWYDSDDNEVKGIGAAIGRMTERFDPNARNADGDELVQEGTPWERVYVPTPKLKLRERRRALKETEEQVAKRGRSHRAPEAAIGTEKRRVRKYKKDQIKELERLKAADVVDELLTSKKRREETVIADALADGDTDDYGYLSEAMIDSAKVGRGDIFEWEDGTAGMVLYVEDTQDAIDDHDYYESNTPRNSIGGWVTHEDGKPLTVDKQYAWSWTSDEGAEGLSFFDGGGNNTEMAKDLAEISKNDREMDKSSSNYLSDAGQPTRRREYLAAEREKKRIAQEEQAARDAEGDARREDELKAVKEDREMPLNIAMAILRRADGSKPPKSGVEAFRGGDYADRSIGLYHAMEMGDNVNVVETQLELLNPKTGKVEMAKLPTILTRIAQSDIAYRGDGSELGPDSKYPPARLASEAERASRVKRLREQAAQIESIMEKMGVKKTDMSPDQASGVLKMEKSSTSPGYYPSKDNASPHEVMNAALVRLNYMADQLESLNKRIISTERAKKWTTQGKSLSVSTHREWLAPVVSYHNIGYSIKGDRVSYDVTGLEDDVFDAFFNAFEVAEKNGR